MDGILMEEVEMEVREGFLCPICHLDLGTFKQLESHYDNVHSNTSVNALNPIKELLGKAKKKILKVGSEDEVCLGTYEAVPSTSATLNNSEIHVNLSLLESQMEGFSRSHMSFFKDVRNVKTKHYFVEINKLLIRLDKLLSELPADPAKRKAYEKSMVDWAPDEDVPLCPTCAQRFRLMRRKHHCRLCGSIMCDECSNFITQTFARRLTSCNTSGDRSSNNNVDGAVTGPITPIATIPNILMSLPRSGSLSSLNSIISSSGELHFRICNHCKSLLDGHNERLEMQNEKPVIAHLYDKLKSSMDEGEQLCPRYFQMVESLRSGATTYSAADAQTFKLKLMRLAETIDVFSKKILLLGTTSEGPQPSERRLKLQKGIFLSANTFLKVKMLGLPSSPNETELLEIREKKQRETEQRLKEAAHKAVISQKKSSKRESSLIKEKQFTSANTCGRDQFSLDAGWNPELEFRSYQSGSGGDQDPIVQQMNIIRNYIKQAKAAYKLEEVEMLSNNLKELQEEYWRQREEKHGN